MPRASSSLGRGRGQAGNDTAFDAAVVGPTENLEGSHVTPVFVPRICNKPVLCAVFHAPAHNLDRMPAELWTLDVLVNTRLVGQEILIDREGGLDRAMHHDFLFNVCGHDRVHRRAMELRALDGSLVALGRRPRGTTRLVVRAIGVVLAWLEHVRVLGFGGQPVLLEEAPSARGVATVAPGAAGHAATRQHVLCRELLLRRCAQVRRTGARV